MKKIRNSNQLIIEKKLLELRRLQLEKEMRHHMRDMQKHLKQSVLTSSVMPLVKRRGTSGWTKFPVDILKLAVKKLIGVRS